MALSVPLRGSRHEPPVVQFLVVRRHYAHREYQPIHPRLQRPRGDDHDSSEHHHRSVLRWDVRRHRIGAGVRPLASASLEFPTGHRSRTDGRSSGVDGERMARRLWLLQAAHILFCAGSSVRAVGLSSLCHTTCRLTMRCSEPGHRVQVAVERPRGPGR